MRADLKAAATGARSEVREAALESGPPKTWVTIADELADAYMGDLCKHVRISLAVSSASIRTTCCSLSRNGQRETALSITKSANTSPIAAGVTLPRNSAAVLRNCSM